MYLRPRDRAGRLLATRGLAALVRWLAPWNGLLVLAYHRIGDASVSLHDRDAWSATAAAFDAQLGFLKRHVDLIGANDLGAALDDRTGRRVMITFDDGYRDNYEAAYPVLRSHNLEATFFVSTGFLDQPRLSWWDEISWMVRASPRSVVPSAGWLPEPLPYDEPNRVTTVRALLRTYKSLSSERTEAFLDFLAEATASGRAPAAAADGLWMSWDMVRQLRAGGMSVGGHTVHHPVLAALPRSSQRAEIRGCGRRLADELGEPMRLFSYPVGLPGTYDDDTRACLSEEGVEFAFSLHGSSGRLAPDDRLDIPRTSVGPSMSVGDLAAVATLPRRFARW